MPWGYLASSTLALLAVAVVLAAPAAPRWLAGLSSRAAVLVAEVPGLVLLWLVVSTVLLITQGDAGGAGAWSALGVAGLAALGLVRCLVLATRAGPVMEQAVPSSRGSSRHPGSVAAAVAAVLMPLPWRPRRVDRTRDVAYGDEPHQRMDVYRSGAAAPGQRPVLVQLHGGGFHSGRRSMESLSLIYQLAARGWVCLSADYRLSRTPAEGHPGHLVDVKRVIAWVRSGADDGIDPARIVLVGTSAGAHLSAMAALTANDPTYQPGFEDVDTHVSGFVALAGYYGPVTDVAGDGTSPFDHLGAGSPPALVVHGTRDVVTSPQTAALLTRRLREAGAGEVGLALLPGAHHTFDLLDSVRFRQVRSGITRFCDHLAES